MNLLMFAVKDMKSGFFLQPMFQRSVAEAMRSWETVANEGQSAISSFPHDFRLYVLAEFDSNLGRVTPLDPPQDLGSAADVKRAPEIPQTLPFGQAASN